MATKRAKTLDDADITNALAYVQRESCDPKRDALYLLLTCRLGLRANEVAHLHFEDVLDAHGDLDRRKFFVSKRGAKYGKARELPMHRQVEEFLATYIAKIPREERSGPLFRAQRRDARVTSDAVQKQLARIYENIGLRGCSSHSGRRTFGTRLAVRVSEFGGSLVDVAKHMGHASVTTTAIYVEPTARSYDLINAL